MHEGIAALAAEAVGAMAAARVTVEYLKTREQFGVPIGAFQALQHRAVDMLMNLEQARSMAILGHHDGGRTQSRQRAQAHLRRQGADRPSRTFVGQEAIQLHGGIGMTMEYKAGHYFRRPTMIDLMFGNAAHLRELARAAVYLLRWG